MARLHKSYCLAVRTQNELNCDCAGSTLEDLVHRPKLPEQAKRFDLKSRYDILDPSFLAALARLAYHGAEKYGEFNYRKSRLSGQKGPINHIFEHIRKYQMNEAYDHTDVGGDERKYHLVAIAFNAMMEFWYEENLSNKETRDGDSKAD